MTLLARRIAIRQQPRLYHTAIRAELRRPLSTGARLTGGTGATSACLTARRCTPWRSASALIDSPSRSRSRLICSNVSILEPIPPAPIRSSSTSSQRSTADRTEVGPVQASTPGPLQISTLKVQLASRLLRRPNPTHASPNTTHASPNSPSVWPAGDGLTIIGASASHRCH